jgi:hypothetical protein
MGPTALTFLIGLFITFIGVRQLRNGKQKLRLEMFDRRYSMYEATKLLIDKIAINGQVSSADLAEFRRNVRGAEFLFDGEARKFFKSLIDLSLRADLARSKQAQAKDETRSVISLTRRINASSSSRLRARTWRRFSPATSTSPRWASEACASSSSAT